jgi:hypothetical protein
MAVRDDSPATLSDKPLYKWLLALSRDHLALLVPIIGVLIFTIRCIIVSSGDGYVAFILATETSVGDAIRALFFTVIPVLLLMLSFLIAFATGTQIASGHWRSRRTLVMAVASIILAQGSFYLSGGVSTIGAASVALVGPFPLLMCWPLAYESVERRRGNIRGRRIFMFFAIGMIAFLFLLQLAPALVGTFWLPRERLVFRNEVPFTGYVLKESEDYLVILRDKPRVVVQKKKTTLDDRDFCYLGAHQSQFVKIAADAPACP